MSWVYNKIWNIFQLFITIYSYFIANFGYGLPKRILHVSVWKWRYNCCCRTRKSHKILLLERLEGWWERINNMSMVVWKDPIFIQYSIIIFQLPIGGQSKRCNFKCKANNNYFCGGYAAGVVSVYETGRGEWVLSWCCWYWQSLIPQLAYIFTLRCIVYQCVPQLWTTDNVAGVCVNRTA